MIRCTPKSDQAVMYATSDGVPAPEFAAATSSGTLTMGPPGVSAPATVAIASTRNPAARPK